MIKNITIAVLAVLVVVFGAFSFGSGVLGSAFTTEYNVKEFLNTVTFSGTTSVSGGFTASGGLTATGALTGSGDVRLKVPVQTGTVTAVNNTSTLTLTAAQICDSSVIAATSSAVATTTTLPTANTMFGDCLTTNGDTISILFRGLGGAASTTYVVAGASTTLVGDTSGDDIIDGGNEAFITFIRASASEMVAIIQEFVAAD